MSLATAIQWTDSTFNIAWGCTKYSPGCANCYAERDSTRYGFKIWGADSPRRTFGEKHWREPLKWNRDAEKAGRRHRVFCSSMCDVFEDHPTIDAERTKLWPLVHQTPWLDWQVLTKRADRMRQIMGSPPPDNLWLGVSVEDQATADERIPLLLQTPAAVRFVSYEPALGPVDFRSMLSITEEWEQRSNRIDWIIVGGESGPGARPCDVAWIRSTVEQCVDAGVPVFVKQLGARPAFRGDAITEVLAIPCAHRIENRVATLRPKDRKGGEPSEWPSDLRVREMPIAQG